MKILKITTATAVAAALMLGAVTTVGAQTTEQNQNQNLRVNCNVGAYGQNSSCTAEGSQNQTQRVVYRQDGTSFIEHDTREVNAGLDFPTMAVAVSTMLTGAAAFVIKNRVA